MQPGQGWLFNSRLPLTPAVHPCVCEAPDPGRLREDCLGLVGFTAGEKMLEEEQVFAGTGGNRPGMTGARERGREQTLLACFSMDSV